MEPYVLFGGKHIYEDDIDWGESVMKEIRKGLLNSRYGIVVLSEAYLAERKWTEHEFQGLLARETVRAVPFPFLPANGGRRGRAEALDKE